MIITTTYKTNASGTGQILAKGGGKQRTVNYNQEHSPEWNHGNAAGTLALAMGLNAAVSNHYTATEVGNGKWKFTV